jgi:processive 1,2-diacylglycerol beta-glucosyltransferase
MRVLVLFCEEGEGHASAARTLAAELERELAEPEVVVVDALAGGLGRVIPFFSRDLYRVQVRWLRWTYGLEYWFFARFPPGRALARWGLGVFGSRPLLRLLARLDPGLIVSTHPSVTNVLGRLRRRGRVSVPVVATITDFGVHPLWAHRGVDRHLVMHERCTPLVERVAGEDAARVARVVVAPSFRCGLDRASARQRLGLPTSGRVAVISGGGWGVGDLSAAVEAAALVPDLTIVCLTGRNTLVANRLCDRFRGEPRVRVVPFTHRMDEYLAAADLLVDATVGVTCLEALEVGCPIVVYGAPPGHSRYNARVLAGLGLAARARSRRELVHLLEELPTAAPPRLVDAPPAASLIASTQAREVAADGARSRRLVALAAATMVPLVLAGWTFASPIPYPLVARTFELNPPTTIAGRGPDVALVVDDHDQAHLEFLAGELSRRGLHASFAVSAVPTAAALALVRRRGDDLIPAPPSSDPARLISERRRFRALAKRLGYRGRFLYLISSTGFTLADYILARTAGGTAVGAAVRVDANGVDGLGSLRPGAVVLLEADTSARLDAAAERLAGALSGRGLRAVPLSAFSDRGTSTRATGAEPATSSAPIPTRPSASSRPRTRAGRPDQPSPARIGATATGTKVVKANTSGATCVTGRRCSADISLKVPTPDATFIAIAQANRPSQR